MATAKSTFECIISATADWYQHQARLAFQQEYDRELDPLVWVRTTCNNRCLNPQHLVIHQPIRIKYPSGVCVYCGFPAGTKDHLIPKAWTGETRRSQTAVVPACAECNSSINDFGSANVQRRREIAHDRMRRRYRNVLSAPDWSESDLAELGRTLRNGVESRQLKKQAVNSRIQWPEDPFYDLRAFQLSGIDDPVALDLCDNPVREAAA